MASVMCLHSSMQEDGLPDHTNVTCHMCTHQSTCRSLCNIGRRAPHKNIKHTHAKISTLKDIRFPNTTPKISFKIHFKQDYVFHLLWLYSKEV